LPFPSGRGRHRATPGVRGGAAEGRTGQPGERGHARARRHGGGDDRVPRGRGARGRVRRRGGIRAGGGRRPLQRYGLRLDGPAGTEGVAEAAAVGAASGVLQDAPGVDVVLTDLRMGGGMDGVTATRRITDLDRSPPVLVLTTYDTDADILAAVEAGATGYMLKDSPPEQLCAAVRTAAQGRTALAPDVATRLMDRVRPPLPALGGRALDILGL